MTRQHPDDVRVVVTGFGAICGNGLNSEAIFASLLAGENKIAPINPVTHFDPALHPQTDGKVVVAVPHTTTELEAMAGIAKPGRHDRHQVFALLAAQEAMAMAGFMSVKDGGGVPDPEDFAIFGATGDGGLEASHEADELIMAGKKLGPFANLKQLPNVFVGQLAAYFNLRGESNVHVTACAASVHSIRNAADHIKLGRATRVLAGGTEAAITRFGIASFAAQRALGTIRPYQTDRDGFTMGEGAAFLVLEEREHALARGAKIYAELRGYGATSDGYEEGNAMTDPDAGGGQRAAELAIRMAGLDVTDVDYVNTHGTATGKGDAAEIEGIRRWGLMRDVPPMVSSTKSYTGHLLGAAGALEAVLCILMMQRGKIIPTRDLTWDNLDPACRGVVHVMEVSEHEIEVALSNGFGFGGTNGALLFTIPGYRD